MKPKSLPLALAAVSAAGLAAAYALGIRPWFLCWGADGEEANTGLPGDEIIPHPRHCDTRAITIRAPAREVWKWLVQIGRNKGGFYSYEWLENLVGCGIHNADRIVPEYQNIGEGDEVWLHPNAPPLKVRILKPNQALVLGSTIDPFTWAFSLRERDETSCRLLIRSRWDGPPGFWNLGFSAGLEPAHFIMERKMLLEIKRRAELQANPFDLPLVKSER